MRIAPLVVALALILPLPAVAQSLGSPTGASAPRPPAGTWNGGITQPPGGYRPERVPTPSIDFTPAREIGKIRHEIRVARDSGQISRGEARTLLRESRRIAGFGYRATTGSVSASESAALRSRLEGLRGRVVAARTRGLAR